VVIGAILAALVLGRTYDGAQFHSARSGVEWTHHALRVQMASDLPGWNPVRQTGWLMAADRDFPPLVPAISALAGFFVGHDEYSIHRFGVIWALLMALATMLVVYRLRGSPHLSLAAGVAALLLPAHHAASLAFYFDLPMAALLWSALAALLWFQDERPVLAGVLGGSLLFLACIAKWTALPVALPLLLGVLWIRPTDRRWDRDLLLLRARAAVPLAVVAGSLVLGFWRMSPRSWNRMLSMSFGSSLDPRTEFEPVGWWHTITTTLGAVPEAISMGRHLSLEALYWYPLHLLFSFLSVPVTILLLAAALPWLRRRGPELPLLLWAAAGHVFLLYAVFSSLDERFLLTLGPALLLPPLFGWWSLPPLPRRLFAALFVVTSLGVAWDFHRSLREPELSEGSTASDATTTAGRVWDEIDSQRRGMGLQSSTDRQWGWMRSDALRPSYFQSRELVFEQLQQCGAHVVLAQEELTLDGFGESFWWEFRRLLAGLQDQPSPESILGFGQGDPALLSGREIGLGLAVQRDAVVAITRYGVGMTWDQLPLPSELGAAAPWQLRARIDRTALQRGDLVLMDGPESLALWTPPGSSLCPQLAAPGEPATILP
jgi:hypothetical protein